MVFDEKTIDSEILYEGAILNLRRDEVTVLKGTSYREIIEHNGGAAIGAITDDGKMVMVKQYRKPAERVMFEVPAGKRDGNESGEEVAIRELKEETGYTADRIIPLTKMYPTPGYSEEILELFLATGLTKGEPNFDENEAIDIEEHPVEALVDMVMRGEIEDAKSIIIILMASEYIRRNGMK